MEDLISYRSTRLPVLFDGDVVVLTGSFAGVAAALALAASGRSVALVEPRTYLGQEATATVRPWLQPGCSERLPEPPASFLRRLGVDTLPSNASGSEVPFAMDPLKLHLEDLLLEAGVKLLYATLPVSVSNDEEGVFGIVVGNKSGRQFLGCRMLIDASERATTAWLTGQELAAAGVSVLGRTLEFDGIGEALPERLEMPEHLNLVGDELLIHSGHRSEKHFLVECRFSGPGVAGSPVEATQQEIWSRQLAMDVAVHLMSNVPQFSGAYLAGSSFEAAGRQALYKASSIPTWGRVFDRHELPIGLSEEPAIAASSLAGPSRGHWYLNDAPFDATLPSPFRDPVSSSRFGEALAGLLIEHWQEASAAGSLDKEDSGPYRHAPNLEAQSRSRKISEPSTLQQGQGDRWREVEELKIPVLRSADVLVVGGGTSGATATATAAAEGLSTVMVEMNPGLGGTGTYGGVNDYWFGRRVGFAARIAASVKAFHGCLKHEFPESEVPRWNIDAKAHVLLERAVAAGAELLFDSIVIASIVEGAEVCGVVVATRFGPVALLARVIIDATGDGDVAAFAGAEHVYGSERGHVTMWYSLAQFALPGHTRNNFTSTVKVSNVEDYTRAILAGRRRKRTESVIHDHGIYLAPRESRHILGEVVLTLTDQLLLRCWPDVVNISFSNNDVKGHTTSDWVRLGLISPNLEVEVPYRAIVPRGLENILVVGKAISATHDALPAIRMQADLENLGGVAALAAALALQKGTTVREVDIGELQERLIDEEVLPASVRDRELRHWEPSDDELREMIEALCADRPLFAYSDMKINEVYRERIPLVDICCAGSRAIPLLTEALHRADGPRRLLLAQGLAIVGSTAGVPDLLSAIDSKLASGELPVRASGIRHAVAPPDQGAMPEVVYLIHALGMTRDLRALAVWQRVVDLLEGVTEADIRDADKDVFDYVDSVCVGAERIGSREVLPILAKLHSYPPFNGQVSASGFQADYFEERRAYLELMIGRAMARCGDPKGFEILIEYLGDARALLTEHAHSELSAISGEEFGKDGTLWRQWLRRNGKQLIPVPAAAPSDPVAAWGLEILALPPDPATGDELGMSVGQEPMA